MVVINNGVDIIEVERVAGAIARHGERFLNRVYTSQELAEAAGDPASLAARFAAKEAVAKTLGCGIGSVGWHEIEVRRDASRRPQLLLHGAAARIAGQLGLTHWAISLSHTHGTPYSAGISRSAGIAIAFVVATGD